MGYSVVTERNSLCLTSYTLHIPELVCVTLCFCDVSKNKVKENYFSMNSRSNCSLLSEFEQYRWIVGAKNAFK